MSNLSSVNDVSAGTAEGTSYQGAVAYFYVPKSSGADASSATDDTLTPGAMLRLGSYSDLEDAAVSADLTDQFFPKAHINDETATSTILDNAGGTNNGKGILMACDGRVLIKAGEKTYIESGDAMCIAAGKALEVTAGEAITITSGDKNDITLTAGPDKDGKATGNVTTSAVTKTENISGNDYTVTKQDSYTINHGDVVGISYGTKTYITFGNSNSVTVGATTGVTLAASISYSFGISMSFSHALSISAGAIAIDFTYATAYYESGTDLKKHLLELKTSLASINKNSASVSSDGARLQKIGVKLHKASASLDSAALSLHKGITKVNTSLTNLFI